MRLANTAIARSPSTSASAFAPSSPRVFRASSGFARFSTEAIFGDIEVPSAIGDHSPAVSNARIFVCTLLKAGKDLFGVVEFLSTEVQPHFGQCRKDYERIQLSGLVPRFPRAIDVFFPLAQVGIEHIVVPIDTVFSDRFVEKLSRTMRIPAKP